eukprot:6468473-Alexandrium_andersonii.AAC.1
MSASLVGSEMCIRDRNTCSPNTNTHEHLKPQAKGTGATGARADCILRLGDRCLSLFAGRKAAA